MERLRRTALLALLLAFPAIYALKPPLDPDLFFHMRVGSWIAEHGQVTRTDPFSVYGAGKPYVAYAWPFQCLVSGVHHAVGFVGIVALTAGFMLLVALLVERLVARRAGGFTQGAIVMALALGGLLRMASPRSWLFSLVFLFLEVDLILDARERGNARRLWLLPLLFLAWANTHIEFVYGLAVLGLALVECVLESVLEKRGRSPAPVGVSPLPAVTLALVLGACALATLVNPYGPGLWGVVLEYASAAGVDARIDEHSALAFRELPDWCILALALGGAFALGWRRESRPLPYLLLALGSFLAFRAGRDGFMLVAVAAPTIAAALPRPERADRFPKSAGERALVVAAAVAIVAGVGVSRQLTERNLAAGIARDYPDEACAAVESATVSGSLPAGPIFNHYDWGGYLTWRLPTRLVTIDGRTNLHGGERIQRSRALWDGASGWLDDPELRVAAVVVAPRGLPLTELLRSSPRFRLVHEDDVALVFAPAR